MTSEDRFRSDITPHGPLRARGTATNPANRFEPLELEASGEALDDAINASGDDDNDYHHGRLATRYLHDRSRTVLNHVDSPDLPLAWTLNPYRGCEHGCSYCYARPTHEYFGLSAGLDFEATIFVKTEAPELLRKELSRPKWATKVEPIAMSGVTDAYQPVERHLRLTRRCLEVMAECRQPVGIVTKSDLVTRDVDLLAELARWNAAEVGISITTLDDKLASAMEPRAVRPERRLEAVRRLADAGVPVGVMIAPIIPGLTDHEFPAILAAAKDAGASWASTVMLRLPYGVKSLFFDWLEEHVPERRSRVESAVREMRAGDLNDANFASRMRGAGPRAEQIHDLFDLTLRRLGLATRPPKLSGAGFRPPSDGQLSLFGDLDDGPSSGALLDGAFDVDDDVDTD